MTGQDEVCQDEVTAWLRRGAFDVRSVGVGDDDDDAADDDLAPLPAILDGVEVVGFGDTTHGTKEFFDLRHRVLRFLVRRMGFRNLVIEASYSAAEAVNDYVVHGRGDKDAALTGLGFAMWDVEEFSSVLDWLRRYNNSVADAEKVGFYGADIWNTQAGRERILRYLRDIAPSVTASAERLFDDVARTEACGPLLAATRMDAELLRRVRVLSAWFTENKRALVGQSSPGEFSDVFQHVLVLSQWIRANVGDRIAEPEPAPESDSRSESREAASLDNYARSRYLAENLFHLLERETPYRKTVIWGHLYHLGIGFNAPSQGMVPNMGYYLRKRFGAAYYVFGLEFNRGSYLARRWPPGRPLADFEVVTIPPATAECLSWQLTRTGSAALLRDLRARPEEPSVARWLTTPCKTHTVSWCHREPAWLYTELAIGNACDGVIFVENTTATTPTKSARMNLSRGAYH
jgi:erythromycin esterase